MVRYSWQVVSKNGDVQFGVVNTFEEAISAIRQWYGDGADLDLSYTIMPVK